MIPWTIPSTSDMFRWFFPSLPKLPNLKLIVYLPKMFSAAGVPSWSCCPAHCWHSTELRTTHKWPVYWSQVRYTHEHTETHLTMGYEVSRYLTVAELEATVTILGFSADSFWVKWLCGPIRAQNTAEVAWFYSKWEEKGRWSWIPK